MYKLHLDTDIGGDIDDFCALAMLLRMPDVELTGITTVAEIDGKRAGYVRHILELTDRTGIPVAAGADVSLGCYTVPQVMLDEERYWGQMIRPSPNPLEQALDLLKKSIEQGATIVGIGPFTNLYLLEKQNPGILQAVPLYLMGGYVYPVREGFPQWGNDIDYNIQVDVRSAEYVLTHSSPTLIPLTVTVETALRRSHLLRLRRAGVLGELLARQGEEFARDEQNEDKLGKVYSRTPDDLINFQHDPLASAIAVGWREGVELEEISLRVEIENGLLYEKIDQEGKPFHVVTRIDGDRFSEFWVETVTNELGHG